jgi:transcriptional regulator with XRE-family HTH domain
MKNNFKNLQNNHFNELAIKNNIETGKKLRAIRNLLVRKPEEIADVLTMTTNTLKNAENGENVGVEIINELILFYGYSLSEFYNLRSLPTWKKLIKKIEETHKAINSKSYEILFDQPSLIDLIEHRLLDTDLFTIWTDENAVIRYCKDSYGYEYKSATNTLNNAVTKEWLIRDDSVKPKKYMKKQLIIEDFIINA